MKLNKTNNCFNVQFLFLFKDNEDGTEPRCYGSGKKPRDYARKKDMRELYQRAERGELDADKTTERTAAALVTRFVPMASSKRADLAHGRGCIGCGQGRRRSGLQPLQEVVERPRGGRLRAGHCPRVHVQPVREGVPDPRACSER